MADEQSVLDPNEIEALLDATPGGGARPAGSGTTAAASEPVPYDFASPDAPGRNRLPALDKIADRFASGLRNGFFGLLRRMPEVTRGAIAMERFGAYLGSLSLPTSLNIVRLAPLPGKALVVLKPDLVFAGLDMLFGGSGRQARVEGREFTAIETRVCDLILRLAFDSLVEAFAALSRVTVEPAGMEVNPRFARIVAPDETVVILRVRIALDGGAGELHVVLPNALLQPLRDQLAAEPPARSGRDPAWVQGVQRELRNVPVEVRTSMGSVSVTLAEFARLAPGDVLPCTFTGTAVLEVAGIPMRRGTLAQLRGRQVVRIESKDIPR